MWYFAYGHDMNWRSLAEWCDHSGVRPLGSRATATARGATLSNYRLAFPRFSEYWNGGVADIIPEPGKSVAGALVPLPPRALELLAQMHERRLDRDGREVGATQLVDVTVTPYRGGDRIAAVTFRGTAPERGHVPPTQVYVSRLVEAALELDLSARWVLQLRSFISWTDDQATATAFPGFFGEVAPTPRGTREVKPAVSPPPVLHTPTRHVPRRARGRLAAY